MPQANNFLSQLEVILSSELALHRKHQQLLETERASIISGNTQNIELATGERALLVEQITATVSSRNTLVKEELGRFRGRLGEELQLRFNQSEITKSLDLINQIKTVGNQLRIDNQQHRSLVSFGQRLVEGTLSIFNSASQTVNRVYGRKGQMVEKLIPRDGSSRLKSKQV